MNKFARLIVIAIATTIALTAFGHTAFAATSEQTKYWAGPSGETVCNVPYVGQGFSVQPGTRFHVTVTAVGGGHVTAKIRFLKSGGSWGEATPFTDELSGTVPGDAAEAWVTVCHTNPEFSYGPVIVSMPVIIVYTDGGQS